MVTGNEYIFDNILQARDYILAHEQQTLANDVYRQRPPMIVRPLDFYRPIKAQDIKPISIDSFNNPCVTYFNYADDSKFIMNRLMSGRYSLKPNLKNRKFLF